MCAVCNRKAVVNAPKLLLIVRLVYAVSNCGERTDGDFTEQGASGAKSQRTEIPADERNVLDGISKAIADLYFVQDCGRENACLVHANDVLSAAEALRQQIT